ncbi:heavy-metal-associated domain-containing protein [Thermaerobacter composti]|uniref:Heavy-metal-associated domain-containing protein n=1 Tax=Thermaerobacter composti TaxID=554949 RepID=A0ABZ0QM44_9FIRM|nr:heavy-metal-associated domain-containing protein [Thermaerobacter composti]WPD18319.1 heavy-metal-associated domain-containing protein [Thermaerobacter composti]
MATRVYQVKGMSCDHCKAAVKKAIAGVPGVQEVDVDLATGRVTVTYEGDLDDARVRKAVEEAGYEVA